MAIYHLEAKMITRSIGRSAVAASAYMSCSRIMNDYDGVLHDYTRKKGLVWEQVFLPDNAPLEWADRSKLWNAVEGAEKTKDSRLARELVVALPVELDKNGWINLLTEYIKSNFVSDGMCADDKDISSVKKELSKLENTLKRLEQQEQKYQTEIDKVLKQYAEYKEQAKQFDAGEFGAARLRIRPQKENEVRRKIEADPKLDYDPLTMLDSRNDTDYLLGYDIDENAVWKYELKKRKKIVKNNRPNKNKEDKKKEINMTAPHFR